MTINNIQFNQFYHVPLNGFGLNKQIAYNSLLSVLTVLFYVLWLVNKIGILALKINTNYLPIILYIMIGCIILCPFKIFCHPLRYLIIK